MPPSASQITPLNENISQQLNVKSDDKLDLSPKQETFQPFELQNFHNSRNESIEFRKSVREAADDDNFEKGVDSLN